MNLVLALVVGVLAATGVYCLMQRSLMRLVIGLILLGQGANLLVFTAGGLVAGRPALVADGASVPAAGVADPLPQALVLTAIVIGFGLTVFALTLVHRARTLSGGDDLEAFHRTDSL